MSIRLPSILAVLIVLGFAVAQPATVTMRVEAFFEGHFKFGEWLPLHVTLANDGPPLQVEVRADTTEAGGQMTYSAPVDLPTGARKQLTLYVLPPSFAQAIRVRLMDGSRELASQSVPVTVERNVNYVIGIAAPRAEAFAVLGGLTLNTLEGGQGVDPFATQQFPRPVVRVFMTLADIPDRPEGLRALDALIVSGTDTTGLTPDQGRALQAWVEQGGRLILGGGASAARTLAGLPDALVKAWFSAGDPTEISALDALGAFAGEDVRVPGPFAVAWPAVDRGLIEQSGQVLLAERRLGEGRVNYVALDLAGSPFDAWAGAVRFWEKLLTPGSIYPTGMPPDVSPRVMRANSIYYALQNLPALELPAIRGLAGLLIIYIVLVGPVNYLVLRRLRKLAWGWITILVLTLAFSAGAFAFSFSLRGGDVIINQISVIAFDTRGVASPAQSFVGIFSPDRNTYTLNFPGRALVAPVFVEGNPFTPWGPAGPIGLASAEIVQGEPAQARGVQVNQGALQAFQVESPVPEDWRIESNLVLDSDRVRGTLVNRTSEALLSITLVYGNRFIRLDDLAPGQTVTVDQAFQSTGSTFPYFLLEDAFMKAGPTGPSREAQSRQQILDGVFQSFSGPPQPPNRPTLIGWMRASPLDVQVTGVRSAVQQTSLILAALTAQYPAGRVRLPFGTLPVRLVSLQGNGGVCGAYGGEVYIDFNASGTLEFQLPEALVDLNVTRLAWQAGTAGAGLPKIELYGRDGQWVEQEQSEVADPARFILADGTVRLRATSTGNAPGCIRYDLEIEGDLQGQ